MLTDIQIRGLKPCPKPYRLFDGGGLYLEAAQNGGKYWRLKYRFKGKEKRLALGVYPAVGLKAARAKRDAARAQLAAGIDPGAARKAAKSAEDDTFEAIAREWFCKHVSTWTQDTGDKTMRRLQRDVFPSLGSRPVGEISAPELLVSLRRIESRGTGNIVHRELRTIGRIFRYAVACGRADRNPATDLEGALAPVTKGHYAAITEPREVGALLRAIDGYRGSFVVTSALKLLAYTFVRPVELRGAEWAEIDVQADEWRIPAERMKMKGDHIVPLSYQARTLLWNLGGVTVTGFGRYVFPGRGCPTISENTLNAALRAMGFPKERMTAHGFRAMARTLLDEVLGVRPDIIEHQLAHVVKDPLGRAYNRTQHLAERRRMMQLWADYLDGLKNGAEVVPIRGRA